MARQLATRIGAIGANRFAKNFHNVRAIRANRLKSAVRNFFAAPKRDPPKSLRGSVYIGKPETIRANRAISGQ